MSGALPGIGVLSALDVDALPVWGIDPSTVRISVGMVLPDRSVRVETLSLPRVPGAAQRFAVAHAALVPWLMRFGVPWAVYVEQPFAQGRRVHPSSQHMLGVLLSALGTALGDTPVDLIGPPSWKAMALGKGRGMAKPPEYLAWAQQELGYTGSLEDEAAALGIAVARALRPVPRKLRA